MGATTDLAQPVGGAPEFAARCARCGAPFVCGVDEPGGCWCARLPRLPAGAIAADHGCLCEPCLRRALAEAGAASDGPGDSAAAAGS